MKSFLEEYGIVIVVAIIILMLIAVAAIFRTSGKNSILSVLNNFMKQAGNVGATEVTG